MNSVWRSLLWKEWREHRVILAILAALFILVPTIFSLRTPPSFFSILTFTLFTVPVISMFLAMNIAAGEQSSGTIRFLQSLPITGRKPAVAKLFWASATLVVPILLAVGVAALLSFGLDEAAQEAIEYDSSIYGTSPDRWFATRCFTPSIAAISLLVWIAAAGVNRSDEVRAGAIGLLVVVSYWGVTALMLYVVELVDVHPSLRVDPPSRLFPILFAMGPGGVSALESDKTFASEWANMIARYWPLGVAALVSHAALAAWYICRFGRVVPGQPQAVERPAAAHERQWLALPRRSPLTAIAWKQLRESAPLAVLGAACIAAIAVVIYLSFFSLSRDELSELTPMDIFQGMMSAWMMVGVMVSTVAGIGVFMDDLKPGLHTFWRSRPISVNQWFAVKFIAGLLVTIFTLAIPLMLVGLYLLVAPGISAIHESLSLNNDAVEMLALGVFLQCALYSGAVAAMTLLRRPIHAAFASIAAAWIAAVATIAIAESNNGRVGVESGVLAIVFAAMLMLAAIILAWIAIRKDWGWKR